jgi:hypothetical protein
VLSRKFNSAGNRKTAVASYLALKHDFRSQYTYLALVLVHTMYSTSSVYGFRNANADVRSHTQSRLLARNRYITDITCPLSLRTAIHNPHANTTFIDTIAAIREAKCMGQCYPEQSVKTLSMLINLGGHHSLHEIMTLNYILS